jgi:hypothetical protein
MSIVEIQQWSYFQNYPKVTTSLRKKYNKHYLNCVLCCVSHNGDDDDHGVRRADTAQAQARWRYLVASHEATDTLYWSMCLAPYLPGGMVVAITVESATFYYIVYNRLS